MKSIYFLHEASLPFSIENHHLQSCGDWGVVHVGLSLFGKAGGSGSVVTGPTGIAILSDGFMGATPCTN